MPAERMTRLKPAPRTGIVHLGLGAFFRAHGAIYTQEAMAASGGDWGVTGVSLQSPGMRDAMVPQGCAYTALELGPDGETASRIEVICGVLVARENPQAVLTAMADPAVRLVSLTVTEKGYCHEPSTGALNLSHPDIVHDITDALPVSAPGFLVRALDMRRKAGLRSFTVMSCDNVPHNGKVVIFLIQIDLSAGIPTDIITMLITRYAACYCTASAPRQKAGRMRCSIRRLPISICEITIPITSGH